MVKNGLSQVILLDLDWRALLAIHLVFSVEWISRLCFERKVPVAVIIAHIQQLQSINKLRPAA